MQILLIGSGGREHAIAWKLAQSKKVTKIFVAPGNAGTMFEEKTVNLNLTKINDFIDFAKNNPIAFTIVGPEAPLAIGIVDQFKKQGLKIWGPSHYCAQLESSKVFAKNFMIKYKIPTAKYQVFTNAKLAKTYLHSQNFPLVIKADGLAAGKGVLVANELNTALEFIDSIFIEHKFGETNNKVVIEEFLEGTEASFIVMIDGKNILPLATSQDYKRLLDNDLGPNTGGMGAYSPAPIITPSLHSEIIEKIIQPVIDGMKQEGHEYTGFLYAGLMIDKNGKPKTLEYNCRLGDPETQPILYRLKNDFSEIIEMGLKGELNKIKIEWKNEFAIGVVLSEYGYPDNPRNNDIIQGLEHVNKINNIKVFHAGTKFKDNQLLTNGGRVLCVVSSNENINIARKNAYETISKINFSGMQYRNDIAAKIN
ncbi:MAG TPA: phosphoribosylamine--glycine ligase [Burkholderiales bacterium]|nr:phosphoribosylamine--glycine ligase [Burkholderiales bacterium]